MGKELGATHVVEGSVRKAGERLRINVQLIDAVNGNHVWAKRFDRELNDIFEIQDEIVHSIVTEVDARLAHGERARAWRRSTRNAEAYDLFWQAVAIFYDSVAQSKENILRALFLIDRAIALDPGFVAAYSHKGVILSIILNAGYAADPKETLAQCFAVTEKAMQLDDADAVAHSVKGMLLLMFTDREQDAKHEINKGLSLDPRLPETTMSHAAWLIRRGDFGAGLAYARQSQDLNRRYSNSAIGALFCLLALIGLERIEEAAATLQRFTERGGAPAGFHRLLNVAIESARGRPEEARDAYHDMIAMFPDFDVEARLMALARFNERVARWCREQLRAIGIEAGPGEKGP